MNVLVVLQTFFCADIPGHIEPHLRVDGGLELQDCTMIMSSTFKSCRTADVTSLLKQVLELNTLAGAQDLLFPRCQEETLRLLASAGRACSSCSMLGELIAAMIAAFTKLLHTKPSHQVWCPELYKCTSAGRLCQGVLQIAKTKHASAKSAPCCREMAAVVKDGLHLVAI